MRGADVWRQGAEVIRRAFPDLHARIDDIIAAGDKVAMRLTFRGTHQGDFLGIPATGRTVEYVSHEFYRIADGMFAEERICSDTPTPTLAPNGRFSPVPVSRSPFCAKLWRAKW
jgi:predicted ester cyclase